MLLLEVLARAVFKSRVCSDSSDLVLLLQRGQVVLLAFYCYKAHVLTFFLAFHLTSLLTFYLAYLLTFRSGA